MITVYVDTETGGVLPQHPTIQLAAVAMDGDVELAAFEQKIAFNESACDPKALEMNHYDAAKWTDAMRGPVAASRFAAWLRPYSTVEKVSKQGKPYRVARVAGYNYVAFDGPRVRALFGTQFCPLEFLARDVLQRVLYYFDESGETPPENFKLSTVAAHFGLSVDGAHDALADARIAAKVYAAVRSRP